MAYYFRSKEDSESGEHFRQAARPTYKVFRVRQGGVLTSVTEYEELRECYIPYRWHRARWGGFLSFSDARVAISYAAGLERPAEVWECEGVDPLPLPEAAGFLIDADSTEDRLSIVRGVWSPGLFPRDAERARKSRLPWPIGTEAYAWVRPVRRIWTGGGGEGR